MVTVPDIYDLFRQTVSRVSYSVVDNYMDYIRKKMAGR